MKHMLAVILLSILWGLSITPAQAFEKPSLAATPLKTVDCWFGDMKKWPAHECFDMQVPENHNKPNGRQITFPVIIFRNPKPIVGRSPWLHLGAGGPGSSMYLESAYSVEAIRDESKRIWLDQGRDFVIIDPRGVGLAKPVLTCDTFIENVISDLQKNLTLQETYQLDKQYYLECIKRYQNEGVELGAYNSLSVVKDIERLRKALKVKQWILYGVSYAAVYAQLLANEYPNTVEAMVLDSAAFPNLKPHHDFIDYTLSPYKAIYNYCDRSTICRKPIKNIQQRFWAIYNKLSEKPIRVAVPHPFSLNKTIPLLLNGNLFIDSLFYGLYGKDIYNRVPEIIRELEKNNGNVMLDEISWYLAYLLDDKSSDISFISHYCYETEPFTHHDLIAEKIKSLPQGYVSDKALLDTSWAETCQHLNIKSINPSVAKATQTDIPTLFLHGILDTVTPLKHIQQQRHHFSNHQLLTYPLSHGVLGTDECAGDVIAAFLLNPKAKLSKQTAACSIG